VVADVGEVLLVDAAVPGDVQKWQIRPAGGADFAVLGEVVTEIRGITVVDQL